MTICWIKIEFHDVKDGDESDLVQFFAHIYQAKVHKTEYATKGVANVIVITLGVIGTWGAERYILNPLANKVESWLKATNSLEGKQFKVVINLHSTQVKTIEVLQVYNPFIIRNIWKLLNKASNLIANSHQKDTIDRVMLIPHKQKKVILLGYTGKHPSYLIDLDKQQILPLKNVPDSDKTIETVIQEINHLAIQIEQLRRHATSNAARIKIIEKEISNKLSAHL